MSHSFKLGFSFVCMSFMSHLIAMDEQFLKLSQKHVMTAVGLLRKNEITHESVAGRLSPDVRRTVDALSPLMQENFLFVKSESPSQGKAARMSPVDRVMHSMSGQQLFMAITKNASPQELRSLFQQATRGCSPPIVGALRVRADIAYCQILIIDHEGVDLNEQLSSVRGNSPFARYPKV